ncbi:MAG: rhomboid family protein [Verrucomicrobiales bacterium]|nr:rhomboid family protein [Verrucomicrobiales bacterium]
MPPSFHCVVHSDRAAAARCPSCRGFFCAECVTEHDGRMLCAECLHHARRPRARGAGWIRRATGWVAVGAGFLLVWLTFLALGRSLASLPDPSHEETLWRETPLNTP